MPINPKFITLLESLKAATAEGRLDWSETFDGETYRVLLDNATVRIGHHEDDVVSRKYFEATLTDQQGNPIEQLMSDYDDEGKYEPLLRDLFELAQRRARKIDDLLDRLISNINSRRTAG